MNGCRGGWLAPPGSAVAGAPEYTGRLPAPVPSGMGTAVAAGAPTSTTPAAVAASPNRTRAFIRPGVISGSGAPSAGSFGATCPCGRQLDLAAFHGHLEAGGVAPQRVPARHRGAVEDVEEVVGVQRIVVEEQEALGLHAVGEHERVRQARVAPADVVGVLGVRVLAVVDQQRRAPREL